jgi:hypothetical protein
LVRSAMPCPCAATMTAAMVVSISPFTGASRATSNGRTRAQGAATPRSPSRNG